MALPLSVDQIFFLQALGFVGWVVLILFPRSKWLNAATLAPAIFVAMLYTMIIGKAILFPDPSTPPLNFFTIEGWMAIVSEPYMVVGITNHFIIVDLWLGRWMVGQFYSKYTLPESWPRSLYFKGVLLITFMIAPFGFLVYLTSVTFYFRRYPVTVQFDEETRKLLDKRSVRFGEELPVGIRDTYHFLTGILGVIALIITLLAFIFLLVPTAFVHYTLFGRRPTRPLSNWLTLAPTFLRTSTAHMRLRVMLVPESKRGLLWTFAHRLLQVACVVEFRRSFHGPQLLFGALNDTFGNYFPFGDGIGVSGRSDVMRILQDPKIRKGPLSLGWVISTSQRTFSRLTTIFLSSSGNTAKDVLIGREMISTWIKSFPHHAAQLSPEAEATLSRILPPNRNKMPKFATIYECFGGTMFFLATGNELTKKELAAYVDAVVNAMIFFPDWFNFLLAGHYLERKGLASYYTLREALAKHVHGPALQAALKVADENKVERAEALRYISIIYSIAGAAAPAKLTAEVIKRLYSDPEKMVPLFDKSPINFIKESARLDKGVPMVNVLSREEMTLTIGGREVIIPENTPLHCSVVSVNRDVEVFGGPNKDAYYANSFDPDRGNLDQIFTWNGLEKLIGERDASCRPPRACPGHDFSISLICYLAERYKPALKGTLSTPAATSNNTASPTPRRCPF